VTIDVRGVGVSFMVPIVALWFRSMGSATILFGAVCGRSLMLFAALTLVPVVIAVLGKRG
jgi:hypothetical protein